MSASSVCRDIVLRNRAKEAGSRYAMSGLELDEGSFRAWTKVLGFVVQGTCIGRDGYNRKAMGVQIMLKFPYLRITHAEREILGEG